ncbi:Hypothetical predicted protein [Octopus vulgaris]|uniref:Uncharacterized protein n=1 Tax=Octopus vulgaris TaxID=6645 RepID=A0AA36AH10_OCTVU|nr:Hypothetical predicted protein [Octopus vulgaris]
MERLTSQISGVGVFVPATENNNAIKTTATTVVEATRLEAERTATVANNYAKSGNNIKKNNKANTSLKSHHITNNNSN